MVLTTCGCLLIFCAAVAVGLFCWLSYACFTQMRAHHRRSLARHTDG